jgi:hypothetical protein
MSDDEEESWEETGSFPNTSKRRDDHVFADEPFDGSYYSVDMVQAGSKEETMTGANAPEQQERFMAVSVGSSDTPAVSNTAEAAALKKKQQPLGIQQNTSMNSSTGFYPYNIYQSLAKNSKEKQEYEVMHEDKVQVSMSSSSNKSTSSNQKPDREEPSMPRQHHIPMSLEDMSSDQSQGVVESASQSQQPYSVISARSRRPASKPRYMVRHTLATSQQVSANPTTMLKNLFIGIEQDRHMHKLTAENLRAVHNWLLFLPAILLTLLSGVVALVFEADLSSKSDIVGVYSSIFVGVAALISVFWQAIGKQLDLGIRGALHDVASTALKRLSEDILLTLSSTENIPAEYVALIAEKFGQAVDCCPSTVPYKLETAFSAVSDRMMLMLRPPMGQPPRKHVQKLDFMRLYATAYDELTTEIIHYWAWPFAYPPPREASDAALRNFKMIITEGREVQKKKGCVRLCCPCLGDATVERSLFEVMPALSVADASHISQQTPKNDPYQIRSHMLGQEI